MRADQIQALIRLRDMTLSGASRSYLPYSAMFAAIAKELDGLAAEAACNDPLFTAGEHLHLRKALVTARRVELGHAKTARHHSDQPAQALATRQAEIYSNLIAKIDEVKA